jgi:hypothetical protein
MVFCPFPKQISTLNRGKLIKNWQTGMRNSFLEKVPHSLLIQEPEEFKILAYEGS